MEGIIRERAIEILDGLPRNETFNWVDRVSIELTVSMLATLFDFPQEERRQLSHWSDCATALPMPGGLIETEEQREAALRRDARRLHRAVERAGERGAAAAT